MGLCPAHLSRLGREDSRPSFGFNSAIGRGYCFSCQWRPDLIELVKCLTGHVPDHDLIISIQEASILRKLSEQKRKVVQDFSINEWTLGYRFQAVPDRLLAQRMLKRRAVIDMGVRWDTEVGCWVMPVRTSSTRSFVRGVSWRTPSIRSLISSPSRIRAASSSTSTRRLRRASDARARTCSISPWPIIWDRSSVDGSSATRPPKRRRTTIRRIRSKSSTRC